MRMVTLGQVGAYEEEWKQYVERLEQYLIANGMEDTGKKCAIFLSTIDCKAYKLLGSLVVPATPGEKGHGDLVKALTDNYCPPPSEIVQRYHFHTRSRQQGEIVAKYISELSTIARWCNFGQWSHRAFPPTIENSTQNILSQPAGQIHSHCVAGYTCSVKG